MFILEGDCDHEHWQGSIIYSIGDGWETDDNVIVTSARDGFGPGTNFARFFLAVMDTDAKDIIIKRDKAGSGEGPADASVFEGLIFEFERLEFERTFSGETTKFFQLIPTKFIGEVKSKSKSKSKGLSKTEIKELRKKILKLAKKSDDHDEFVEAVLNKFPEVEDIEDLYEEVLDEDGIYDEA